MRTPSSLMTLTHQTEMPTGAEKLSKRSIRSHNRIDSYSHLAFQLCPIFAGLCMELVLNLSTHIHPTTLLSLFTGSFSLRLFCCQKLWDHHSALLYILLSSLPRRLPLKNNCIRKPNPRPPGGAVCLYSLLNASCCWGRGQPEGQNTSTGQQVQGRFRVTKTNK